MCNEADDTHLLGLGLSTMLVAAHLVEGEADDRRRTRKAAVLGEKWSALRDRFPVALRELQGYGGSGPSLRQLTDTLSSVTRRWPLAQRSLLLIDLLLGNPFAPSQLRVSPTDLRATVDVVAEALGLDDGQRTALAAAYDDALRMHRPGRLRRLRAAGAGAVTFDASRIPGSQVAVGPVPDDEARHRLLLGGGTPGADDVAFAAGMWLLPRAAAADRRARPRLVHLSAARTGIELMKLQMAQTLVIVPQLLDDVRPTDVVGALAACEDELERELDVERARNDDDAARIVTLEEQRLRVRATRHAVDGTVRPAA